MRANKLGLVVIDGSSAMEGNGPTDGTQVPMETIIAGTNPLATDMVAASLMGFEPDEISTFTWARKAGLRPRAWMRLKLAANRSSASGARLCGPFWSRGTPPTPRYCGERFPPPQRRPFRISILRPRSQSSGQRPCREVRFQRRPNAGCDTEVEEPRCAKPSRERKRAVACTTSEIAGCDPSPTLSYVRGSA